MQLNNKYNYRDRPIYYKQTAINSKVSQLGMSLIEIMVGLVIGLLATLVIMQVFSVFEGQKRITTGTADAQTNGNIALFNIQRDIQLAGFGLLAFDNTDPNLENSPYKCNPSPAFDPDNNPATLNGIPIFPINIADGGAASDVITVRYGSSAMGGIPSSAVSSAAAGVPANMRIGVDNNMGCRVNDVVMIVRNGGASCAVTKVTGPTDINAPPNPPVPTGPAGTYTINAIEVLRDPDGNVAGAAGIGANISCLGRWDEVIYSVNNNQLVRNGDASVGEIVNVQAQYGVATTAVDNKVTEWVDASGATWSPATLTVANRNRIRAIRVAVVARNGLREKEIVTNTCITAKGTNNNGPCAWDDGNVSASPKIDLSNDADWQYYRYRVYETIIPLRNMVWSKNIF